MEVFCYLAWERSCRWSWWKTEINSKEKGDEEEKGIGKVVTKCHDHVCVTCLEKPFGIHQPQLLEREEDSFYFSQVYRSDITPELTQIDANGKKGCKWFWYY